MSGYFNYSSLVSSVDMIVGLNEEQYTLLRAATSGEDPYDHSLSHCNELAKRLDGNFEAKRVFQLLVSLEFLYDRSREWEKRGRDRDKSLREFLEVTGIFEKLGSENNGFDRLLGLIAKNAALERRTKLKFLRTGVLATATAFTSFVDIRPRFAEDRSALEELVPVVILRVTTEEDGEESERSPVFQLNLSGVQKLRVALDDVEKKLKALKEDRFIGERLNLDASDEELDT
jgi:hypothetical protein